MQVPDAAQMAALIVDLLAPALARPGAVVVDATLGLGGHTEAMLRRALELDAVSIVLCHNHPSGDPTPSRADIEMTRQVVQAGLHLNVEVHDHLVVGRHGVASFKQLGLM